MRRYPHFDVYYNNYQWATMAQIGKGLDPLKSAYSPRRL